MTRHPIVPSQLPAPLAQRLQISYSDIVDFCQRWHIAELSLFGSVLRQDFRADSDVDVLVTFHSVSSRRPFHRSQAQAALAERLGRSVDLTETDWLTNPVSQQEILGTRYVLYPSVAAQPFQLRTQPLANQERLRNAAAVADMIRAIQEIQEDTNGLTFEDYQRQRTIRRAVERNCEIIGEAARRVTPGFQAAHPTIDWSGAIGFRNVIIHRYDQVNDREIWTIVSVILPPLLVQLQALDPGD